MDICLLGDFSDNLDEGFKNTGYYLARELEKLHNVTYINIKHLVTGNEWVNHFKKNIRIIHTIAQPTNSSIVFTWLLKRIYPGAKTVISALKPETYFGSGQISHNQKIIFRISRPDLVLTQSDEAKKVFKRLGCKTETLFNGVDTDRFKPASIDYKLELRKKYNLDPQLPVVLHVGHLVPQRNLSALAELPQTGVQVVVAGSLYLGANRDLIDNLRTRGLVILEGYQSNIEELYMLADCYAFPPKQGDSISMPLSVLEAMACNLPVVTTRFKTFESVFRQSIDFRFVDQPESLVFAIKDIINSNVKPNTRQMVLPYSWKTITQNLDIIYKGLLSNEINMYNRN